MATNIDETREGLAYVEAVLTDLHERNIDKPLEGDDRTAWDEGVEFVKVARAAVADFEARQAVFETAEAGKGERGDSAPFQIVRKGPAAEELVEDRTATAQQIIDAVTRSVEESGVDPTYARSLLRRHSNDRAWARNLLARSTPKYQDAFFAYMGGRQFDMPEELRAALSVGTSANGGYLVPTHLDPTVILTNSGTSNVIRSISRVVTLTSGNTWNGVTSAGVTASWDAELAEVSDDSPTFGSVSIPTYKAQAFIQASIEAFEDIAGLASDALMLFADARDRLEGAAHATGSGSAPTGIFTALDANTNVELTTTTAATVGLVDLDTVYRSVPVRFRGKAKWLMNPIWALAIKDLGTAVSASFSGDLREAPAGRLLGKDVVESDDAPATQTTTVKDNVLVLGDFSSYVVVDKPGSTAIEFIPHLFNTSNNLPDGRRGWYMHFRSGADSVNDVAFRLLQDKTSA